MNCWDGENDRAWIDHVRIIRERRAKLHNEAKAKMIAYLQLKVGEGDWHGVSDAANDLRVMEARNEATQ